MNNLNMFRNWKKGSGGKIENLKGRTVNVNGGGGMTIKAERQRELIDDIMDIMEEMAYTVGEVEEFPEELRKALHQNSEQFRKNEPFAIYKP